MSKQYRRLCHCNSVIPTFALPNTKATHCAKCKSIDMISTKTKCQCGKAQPVYNLSGEKTPICCASCKHSDMVDVVSRRCQCGKYQPLYNLSGEKIAICCKECKQPDMINIKEKRKCECGLRRPTFHYPDEPKPKYCSDCRLPDMIDILNVRCFCKKSIPFFDYPHEKVAKYCASCRLPDMVNIRDKLCLCKSAQPSYNYPDKKERLCCIKCCQPGMVNIVDMNRKCVCKLSRPTYGLPNETIPTHCASCRTSDMIDILHTRCECKKYIPSFNYKTEKKPICCSECKKEDMINIVDKQCPGNPETGCPYQRTGNVKYRNYCTECFRREFPLDPLTFQIRAKTKEIAVRDYINSVFDGFSHDRPLETSHCDCTIRRRIDHRKLIGNTLLAIETDENQHKSYDTMSEETRYDDLFMAHSGKWMYVRFNPDKYVSNQGKSKNPCIATRLEVLKEEIERQIRRIEQDENTELVERVYLYYDGYD